MRHLGYINISTFYLASLIVTLCYLNFIVGAARCFLSATTSVGMLYQKIHMNSSPIVLPKLQNLLLSACWQVHDRTPSYIQTFQKITHVAKARIFPRIGVRWLRSSINQTSQAYVTSACWLIQLSMCGHVRTSFAPQSLKDIASTTYSLQVPPARCSAHSGRNLQIYKWTGWQKTLCILTANVFGSEECPRRVATTLRCFLPQAASTRGCTRT